MDNNFNLKQYLSEGKLLSEIEVKMPNNLSVDFLNKHKNEIIDAIGANMPGITPQDISNAKKHYFFDKTTPGINTWYALTFNDDTMPNYVGYTDPRSAIDFESIYLSPNEDDFIKQIEHDYDIPEDEGLPGDAPIINSLNIAGRTLYYSNYTH